eukprot:TRINITY_DN7447_c0_g1_i3.p1 TRINITY_DN7447_c0_g1~~TRINITY_DN7447_c0_g1_i3.p1  ORF type:complete len:317 (+),score=50.76 TRINITY_DN7447_c0_g1_i3:118-1068(+)
MDIEGSLPAKSTKPLCLIVIGMAGSGKTTFVNQLILQCDARKKKSYTINLDPGVFNTPYRPNIDIRNTINYKEMMKTYKLGPNGAILTSLNLFSTKFDEVLGILEKKAESLDYIIVDTPGQIELFTWSASGMIIASALASTLPCAIVYVLDGERCSNPNTFMSNMIFCCSIMYKLKLPVLTVINKADVSDTAKIKQWTTDYDAYLEALSKEETYLSDLSKSMCLSLDEFYKDLDMAPFGSLDGFGADGVFNGFEKCRKDYFEIFLPDLQKKKQGKESKVVERELEKFKKDVETTVKQNAKDSPDINTIIDLSLIHI